MTVEDGVDCVLYVRLSRNDPKSMRDGVEVEVPRSPRLIKKALSGTYETREAYDRRDREARSAMAARLVLGLGPKEKGDA